MCVVLDVRQQFWTTFQVAPDRKKSFLSSNLVLFQQHLSTRNKYISSGIKINNNIALVKESESGFWGLVVGSQADVVIDLIN